ncbi:MAG: hypothetical protein AAF318_19455 [Pseudomonadota bacterium]
MLKSLSGDINGGRLAMGSKNLSHDATWSRPAIADIEVALLRAAAFPELSQESGLRHEFIVLDPSADANAPEREDVIERVLVTANRMAMPVMVVGHQSHPRFGAGGFETTADDRDALNDAAFSKALAALQDRVGWVLTGSRFNHNRHIFVPQMDMALLAIVVDLLSQMKPEARPFVHLASRVDAGQFANRERFGDVERFGRAIHQLNTDRPRVFVYGWSPRVAHRLGLQMGIGVQPLDLPPELALLDEPARMPDRFTAGYFSSSAEGEGLEHVEAVIRAANAAVDQRRFRFVVQIKPNPVTGTFSPFAEAVRARLSALPAGNVTVIDQAMPRRLYLDAIRQVDAVMLLRPTHSATGERISLTATHAMAAGKLILTFDDAEIASVVKSRVFRASDAAHLGEIVGDLASDLRGVRTAARVARSAHFATMRPSRLFAQLLYGPLILANASGHEVI